VDPVAGYSRGVARVFGNEQEQIEVEDGGVKRK
jgi:hypothetical protein